MFPIIKFSSISRIDYEHRFSLLMMCAYVLNYGRSICVMNVYGYTIL